MYLEMYQGIIETWITRPLQSNKQCLKMPRLMTKLVLLSISRYTSVKLDSRSSLRTLPRAGMARHPAAGQARGDSPQRYRCVMCVPAAVAMPSDTEEQLLMTATAVPHCVLQARPAVPGARLPAARPGPPRCPGSRRGATAPPAGQPGNPRQQRP